MQPRERRKSTGAAALHDCLHWQPTQRLVRHPSANRVGTVRPCLSHGLYTQWGGLMHGVHAVARPGA
jgi:hypothetical protein